ncbi:hypothetical protein Tco_1557856 [Tanacetum coccineum]
MKNRNVNDLLGLMLMLAWRLEQLMECRKYFKGHGFDIPYGSVCYVFDRFEDTRTLQYLPFSPATNPGNPGRLVAWDRFPGRHVARDMLNGKARWGYVPGRLTRATTPGPHTFSQTIKFHDGGFSRATCRPGLLFYKMNN